MCLFYTRCSLRIFTQVKGVNVCVERWSYAYLYILNYRIARILSESDIIVTELFHNES